MNATFRRLLAGIVRMLQAAQAAHPQAAHLIKVHDEHAKQQTQVCSAWITEGTAGVCLLPCTHSEKASVLRRAVMQLVVGYQLPELITDCQAHKESCCVLGPA
jgi:hypothetical protein